MRKIALLILGLVALPGLAFAQQEILDCPDCILGVWTDTNLQINWVDVPPFTPTVVYLGMQLGAGQTGVTGVEFSIHGFDSSTLILQDVTPLEPATVVGTAPAPADTSAGSSGTGGMNIAWPGCMPGTRALASMTLLSLSTSITDRVIKVLRKFPPSSPNYNNKPVLVGCDIPVYTAARITGGCFIVNYSGNPVGTCALGTAPSTWSGVKELFR